MLTILAAAAVGLALGGGWVARWQTADQMVMSLIRSEDICDEAEAPDDWGRDCWWELVR